MRTNLMKIVGLSLFMTLLMPMGMLFANESGPENSLTSNTANWYDVEEASNLLGRMQTHAINARNALGQNEVSETDLAWQIQALNLDNARSNVNRMGADLAQLDKIGNKVEPWQLRLIQRVTPQVHQMAHQLDAAIDTLNKYQSKDHLALTRYPQNIKQVCRNANQLSGTIGSVTRSAHTEEKVAALHKLNVMNTGS